MRRYSMRTETHMIGIDAEFSPQGRKFLQKYRSEHPKFKGAHIIDVIQVHPSEVPLEKQYNLTREGHMTLANWR